MKTMTLASSDPGRGPGIATRRDPYAAEGGADDTGTVIATRPSIRPVRLRRARRRGGGRGEDEQRADCARAHRKKPSS